MDKFTGYTAPGAGKAIEDQDQSHKQSKELSLETAFSHKNKLLVAILDNVEDAIVGCDADGMLTIFNRAAREFLCLSAVPEQQDLWALPCDFYLSDGKTLINKEGIPLYRALHGDRIKDFEMVIVPKDGNSRRVMVSAHPFIDSEGRKLGAITTAHDITDQRNAERELRKQRHLFEYIVNTVPHSVFWKDRNSRFLGGNKLFLNKALGVNSAEEMIGRDDYAFFPQNEADYFRKCDSEVMESGTAMFDIEEPQSQPEGGVRTLLTSKVPLRDETGEVIGLLGVFADITERKRMEEELAKAKEAAEAATKAKSDFLATVSHELRTPLTLILGPVERILSTYESELSENLRTELTRIKRNAARLLMLVSDILDVSKIEEGHGGIFCEILNISNLVKEMSAETASLAQHRNIALTVSVDPLLNDVCIDRRKFEKIALNLIGNALKFTPSGGRVDVIARRYSEGAGSNAAPEFEFSVVDTGPGISEEHQKLLFQKFQQIDSSAARRHDGTGLGLALVKEFASLMGGRSGLESTVGKGSRFFVILPLTPAQTGEQQHALKGEVATFGPREVHKRMHDEPLARTTLPQSADGPLVLVVEDNPDMRAYVTEILREEYLVETASNGQEALKFSKQRRPDVVVSDIMMPEMDGLELVSRFKEDPELRRIPVILLTARMSPEEIAVGLNQGADDYLAKPFAPSELKARVRSSHRLFQAIRDLERTDAELRSTQGHLIEAEKSAVVATLVSGLSHELNNPLAAILMIAQLLLTEKTINAPAWRNSIASIETQAKRCGQIVRAISEASILPPARRDEIAASALFSALLARVAPLLSQNQLDLRVESGLVSGLRLSVNVNQIETALLNIVSNAIDASPEESVIEICMSESLADPEHGVEITVKDLGCGIAVDVLPHVFNPFFTTKDPGKGTGLGLSIAKKIIESHGGRIVIESKESTGTLVRVRLPAFSGVLPS